VKVAVYDSSQAVAEAAAAHIAGRLAASGSSTLGLAGGSTPGAAYRLLPDLPIDWSGVTMWLGDERWVPAHHADSNERMAREAFVDAAGGHLVAPSHGDDPQVAASAYAAALDRIWVERDESRRPDLVLLGMGDDGHTASLFPGSAGLDVRDRTYVANYVEPLGVWRLTATLPLLWSARELVFLVTGEAKAEMLRRIIDDAEPLPAQRVASGCTGAVSWMVDEAAAARLHRPGELPAGAGTP
jgi:6-phosphogluconolactonase